MQSIKAIEDEEKTKKSRQIKILTIIKNMFFPTIARWILTFLTFTMAWARLSFDDIKEINCQNLTTSNLKDTKLVYRCMDNGHMVYHVSKLNTLTPEEEKFPVSRRHAWRRNVWIEVQADEYHEEEENLGIPYTGCLSVEYGETAVLKGKISDSIGANADVDLNYAFLNAAVVRESLGLTGNVGGSISLSAEYACSANKGLTVQVVVMPLYYLFENAAYREVSLSGMRFRRFIKYGPWKVIPALKAIASAKAIKCVTKPELLQCDGNIPLSLLGGFGNNEL